MVRLGRQELDVWLGEPDDFVLAVLRDIYGSDAEVTYWLHAPRPELGGRSAVDLLSSGHRVAVESALVQQWNDR